MQNLDTTYTSKDLSKLQNIMKSREGVIIECALIIYNLHFLLLNNITLTVSFYFKHYKTDTPGFKRLKG